LLLELPPKLRVLLQSTGEPPIMMAGVEFCLGHRFVFTF